MSRGIRRLIRRILRRPYRAVPGREQNAMDLWHDAATKGGFFWSALVGEHERGRGVTRLSNWCGQRCGQPQCKTQGCACDNVGCREFRIALVRREFE